MDAGGRAMPGAIAKKVRMGGQINSVTCASSTPSPSPLPEREGVFQQHASHVGWGPAPPFNNHPVTIRSVRDTMEKQEDRALSPSPTFMVGQGPTLPGLCRYLCLEGEGPLRLSSKQNGALRYMELPAAWLADTACPRGPAFCQHGAKARHAPRRSESWCFNSLGAHTPGGTEIPGRRWCVGLLRL